MEERQANRKTKKQKVNLKQKREMKCKYDKWAQRKGHGSEQHSHKNITENV